MNTALMIVAVVTEKGGVGKTTLSLTWAVAAVQAGRKVAVLDTDPQSTASKWTDRRDAEMPWSFPLMPHDWVPRLIKLAFMALTSS